MGAALPALARKAQAFLLLHTVDVTSRVLLVSAKCHAYNASAMSTVSANKAALTWNFSLIVVRRVFQSLDLIIVKLFIPG